MSQKIAFIKYCTSLKKISSSQKSFKAFSILNFSIYSLKLCLLSDALSASNKGRSNPFVPRFPEQRSMASVVSLWNCALLKSASQISNFQHFRAVSMRGITNWNCQYVSPNFLMVNGLPLLARLFGFEVIRLPKLFHPFFS